MKKLLLFLVLNLAADEASQIREARHAQNSALAAGDADLAASFWTEDVTLRRGLGAAVSGKEAYRALLEHPGFTYVREPEAIEVSPDWPLAFESGTWTALQGEDPVMSGRYSAQWVKREGVWLIRSELFVALACQAPVNSWPALP